MFAQIILIWNYKKQVLYAEEIFISHGFVNYIISPSNSVCEHEDQLSYNKEMCL